MTISLILRACANFFFDRLDHGNFKKSLICVSICFMHVVCSRARLCCVLAPQNVAQSVSIAELNASGFFPKDKRIIGDVFLPEEGKDALGITITRRPKDDGEGSDDRPPGMGTQVSLLFQRELKNLRRDVTAVGARFGLTTFLGVLIGIIFYDVGSSDSSVSSNLQSHFGAMIMVLLMTMFGTAQPALLAFPDERPVFLREYSTNHYSAAAYFLSRFSIESTITAAQVLWMVSWLLSRLILRYTWLQ